jgi:hypothetical protein
VIHYGTALAPSSDLLHHWGMDGHDPLTNDEVRRRRLAQLADEVEGGLKAIAEQAEVSAANLTHILKRRAQGTARANGHKPPVAMGDKVARQIETALHLAPGWLDWPFANVDFDAFVALGGTQRLIVQVKMNDAIKEQSSKKSMVRQVDRTPVSNKKVEQHLPALSPADAKAAHEKATSGRLRTSVALPGEDDLFASQRDAANK